MNSLLHPNRIAWKLIRALIVFSSLITLVTTATQLWFEYDRDVDAIQARFLQVERGYKDSVAENVWQADMGRLTLLLNGIIEFPDFRFAGVREESGEALVSIGEETNKNVIRKIYPLHYNYRGENLRIGELEVIASLTYVYDRTFRRFGVILVSNGIKTFLVAGFMFMLVFWLLTRHLNMMANFSRNVDISSPAEPLRLNRGYFSGKHDEMDQLADTLNEMQQKLSETYLNLNESERQKRLILQTVPDLIWLKDVNGVYLACNPMFEQFFGAAEHEIVGKTDHDYVDAELADFFRKNDIAAMEANHPRINEEWVTFASDGHQALLETVKTPFKQDDGNILGVLGIGRDITKRKQIEEELRLATAEAEMANQAKSEFLASMSHELRTPLNAILGFGQLMQIDPNNRLSPTQSEHIESILAGGAHLLELVNEILDLARIEAKQDSLNLEEVNANDIVANCVALTSPIGEPRGITIIDQFSQCASSLLRTDRMRFKQVLLNLLSNAVKYNRDEGTVTIEGHETDTGFLRISVTDTGSGIDKKHYFSVFHMFRRLGEDPAITHEGTGIGLTVTKLLVEHMAGQIGFDSKVGIGSTFWFELPLASNTEAVIWADTLRIGVDSIDKDHQQIIVLLNRVSHRTIEDIDLDEVVQELLDYTRDHFVREETVMEACGYPDLEHHRALHREISDQVSDLERNWNRKRDPAILHQLREFLRGLWIDHVMREDAGIAAYTEGKGQAIRKALKELEKANKA